MCEIHINKWLCHHVSYSHKLQCIRDYLPETRHLCIRTSKNETRMKECFSCATYYKKHGKPNPDAPRNWRRERKEKRERERQEAELESIKWIAEMGQETERLQMELQMERLQQEEEERNERCLETKDEQRQGELKRPWEL